MMKTKTKLTTLLIIVTIAVGLLVWGSVIMRNYEGYLEVMKEARHAAMPQIIIGLVLMLIAYILTYVKE